MWKSVSSFSKIKYCGVISQLLGDTGEGSNTSNGSAAAIVDESPRISVSDEGNCEDDDEDDDDGSESGISAESPSAAEAVDVKLEMEAEIVPDHAL